MLTTVGRLAGAVSRRLARPFLAVCHNAVVKNFLIRVVLNGIALWVAALIVDGVSLGEGTDSTAKNVLTIVFVALIFGLLNAIVKPIARLLSLPFILFTLGLFLIVVNAFMLQLLEWICEWLDLPFTIDEFWWDAIWAALIISIVSWVLDFVLPDDD
jgi:putative membrane protein